MMNYEEQKAAELDAYEQIVAIRDNDGNIIKAKFVYCSKSAKYIVKKGPTLDKLCSGCVVIKQNF